MGCAFYILFLLVLTAGIISYILRKENLRLQHKLAETEKRFKDLVSQKEQLAKTIQESAERRDFKVKMISMLAHDFRGAFMNLISLMEFYKKGEIPPERFSALFEELKSTSQNNLETFKSTLSWVKTHMDGYRFKPEQLNVFSAIENAVRNNSSEIKRKEISLSVKGDKEAKALADEQLLSFVLNSLVNNAVKFSHPGGVVDCVIRKDQNNLVQVHVTDFGVGMDNKTLSAIFSHDKTIYTGTLGEKGAGIALVICKDFIEMQHGSLAAVSEEGTGSVFTLSVPCV